MSIGAILVTFILALIVGAIVYFIATLIEPFKTHAHQIAVAAFVLVLIVRFLPLLNQ